jgi:tRNA pseudouridine38-40 synthase
MARYKVILAYDGTHFLGFQRQGPKRTVQAELEKALRGLGWTGRAILSSGRTDSGVHAAGQVAAFDLEWAHSDEALVSAINVHLPQDAAVLTARKERDDFHPRFDALERCYR